MQTLKMEAHERRIDGNLVGWGAPTDLKKGGHDCSTYPFHLPMVVPPGKSSEMTTPQRYCDRKVEFVLISTEQRW